MFESFGKDSQGKRLNLRAGFILGFAINHGPRYFGDLSNPAAIGFFFKFNCEVHANIIGRIYFGSTTAFAGVERRGAIATTFGVCSRCCDSLNTTDSEQITEISLIGFLKFASSLDLC